MKKACTVLLVACLLQACSYYEMKEETARREKTWVKEKDILKEESVCASSPATTSTPYNSSDNPFHFHQPISEFSINTDEDNLLTGENGINVFLPAHCFDTDAKNVMVSMVEYTNAQDLFLAQLTTVSNDKPLISGGTVHVTAWENGKELNLKKGKEISVIFKRDRNRTDDMMAFYGTRTSTGTMNWPSFTPSWKENFYENGFHSAAQERQDSLAPQIKRLRDSIMKAITLTAQQRQWLNQESDCEKNPKFYLTKDEGKFYRLDSKHFSHLYGSEELQQYAVGFFRILINDSLVQHLNETVSFSPAIERKPFYEGENEFINALVKKVKGDTANAAAFMAQYAINNYILRATQMGFINCDRFYNYPNNDQEILVDLPEKFNGKVQLLIPAVNGVYEARKKDENTWAFANLPKGLPCTLLAFTPVKGKISASVKKIKTGNGTHQDMVFKRYPCPEFIAIVQDLK